MTTIETIQERVPHGHERAAAGVSGPIARTARDETRARLQALADVAALAVSLAIAGFVTPSTSSGIALVAILGLWVLLNRLLGLYGWESSVIDKSTVHELPRLAQSLIIGIAAILIFAPDAGLRVDRYGAVEFAAIALMAMVAARASVRKLVWRWYGPERALIVGSGTVANLIYRKLRTHPFYGTEILGSVDTGADEQQSAETPPLLGDLSCIEDVCTSMGVERLIVAFSRIQHQQLLDAIRAVSALGLKVTVVPRLFEVLGRSAVLDDVEGLSVLSLQGRSRTRLALASKRALDIVGATVGLVLLAPLLALISLAIKLDSTGPVIFAQVRIGRGNKPFRIRKFRTMVQDADQYRAQLAELNEVEYPLLRIPEDRDPRLTRVGRILRRTMLDELPQLWNVLRGDMSLVGPRPLEPRDDAEVIGWHRARLEFTPGITGPWQALGRHAIPFREMVTLDCLYVANWSLWNDIKLIVRTFQVVVGARKK